MSDAAPIRILVVDDNQLMRMGVIALLRTQPDLALVGEARDGAMAVTLYRQLQPDVVLLDMRMPTMDGLQVTTAICAQHPEARILVLTHYDGDEQVFQAVRAGARGYLTKEAAGDTILEAIRALHAGGRYLPLEIVDRLAEHMRQPPLTGREKQVLAHLAEGLTNREIAEKLGISERTVGIYVSNVLGKLDAKTRTEAAMIAVRRGLLRR